MKGIFKSSLLLVLGIHCRRLSTSQLRLAVDKSMLSKLRKQTGIPFINCKKALEKFDNDFDQAKKWLQEEAQREGWARATKLQTRPMSQGLVALIGDRTSASVLEVNCETDFVARNEKFVGMVSTLVQDCHSHFVHKANGRVNMGREELEKLTSTSDQQTSLADIVALNVGNLGENMALRRAAFMKVSDDSILCSYVHPANSSNQSQPLRIGKYGAIVELCKTLTDSVDLNPTMDIEELGSHICQHIVGMNPKSVGEYNPSESDATVKDIQGVKEEEKEGEESEVKRDEEEKEEEELLQQSFLLDSSMSVGELLYVNNVIIKDFVRFACGEELEEDKE